MSTPVQHCLITGAYLPIIKRRVNLCSTYIQFQDNYPSEYKRFGIGRDEMMILMPQVMGVDVLSGLDKLKYVGEDDEVNSSKGMSSEMMEMNAESKILKESDEEMDGSDDEGTSSRAREGANINIPREERREGTNSIVREGTSSRAREGANINIPREERREGTNSIVRDESIISMQRDERLDEQPNYPPHSMRTDAHERMSASAQFSGSDSNGYSDDYYDYDVDIDEDYDTDEEFTDDYDD